MPGERQHDDEDLRQHQRGELEEVRALCPLATTVSISRTAWVSQTTPVKISTKKPSAASSWRRM